MKELGSTAVERKKLLLARRTKEAVPPSFLISRYGVFALCVKPARFAFASLLNVFNMRSYSVEIEGGIIKNECTKVGITCVRGSDVK